MMSGTRSGAEIRSGGVIHDKPFEDCGIFFDKEEVEMIEGLISTLGFGYRIEGSRFNLRLYDDMQGFRV